MFSAVSQHLCAQSVPEIRLQKGKGRITGTPLLPLAADPTPSEDTALSTVNKNYHEGHQRTQLRWAKAGNSRTSRLGPPVCFQRGGGNKQKHEEQHAYCTQNTHVTKRPPMTPIRAGGRTPLEAKAKRTQV